jgi:hypothetical protein
MQGEQPIVAGPEEEHSHRPKGKNTVVRPKAAAAVGISRRRPSRRQPPQGSSRRGGKGAAVAGQNGGSRRRRFPKTYQHNKESGLAETIGQRKKRTG